MYKYEHLFNKSYILQSGEEDTSYDLQNQKLEGVVAHFVAHNKVGHCDKSIGLICHFVFQDVFGKSSS